MTTNLKCWLHTILAFVLFGTAIWQGSIASAMHGMPIEWTHLFIALLLIVLAALLISHEVIGEGMIDRLTILTFLFGFVWYGMQALNGFVLDLNAEKQNWDLLRGATCGALFLVSLAYQIKKDTDRFQG